MGLNLWRKMLRGWECGRGESKENGKSEYGKKKRERLRIIDKKREEFY